MTTSLRLMVSHSHCRPPFGQFKGTGSIYASWVMPLCLGLVQFLQLAAKEHKNGYQNDVDDDNAGTTATTDVTVAVRNDAATATVKDNDMGSSVVIGVTTIVAILQTTDPKNVTISWTMLTNDDDDNAHNGNDG